MRTYSVTLWSPAVGRLTQSVLANGYQDAEQRALSLANEDPEHLRYAPWRVARGEVAA